MSRSVSVNGADAGSSQRIQSPRASGGAVFLIDARLSQRSQPTQVRHHPSTEFVETGQPWRTRAMKTARPEPEVRARIDSDVLGTDGSIGLKRSR